MTAMVTRPDEGTTLPLRCNDCGCETSMSPSTVAKGSSVREPGEALCGSCNSKRIKMMREVMALPDSMDQIRAKARWGRPISRDPAKKGLPA